MCLDALDTPGIGICGPVLYLPDGNLQSGCGSVSKYMKIPRSSSLPIDPFSECDWVTGAALFCRGEALEEVGFDGSYFLGFEDVDIGYRARLAGWKVILVAAAQAEHPARTTLKGARPVYYGTRNQIWFARRHGTRLAAICATLYSLRVVPRVVLADLIKRRSSHTALMWHGLVAGWRPLPEIGEPLLDEPIPSRWIDWQRNRRR
jgi:N-acetylglucosaminyl-diphospho-decaprenol L-rhamnosyltransferase